MRGKTLMSNFTQQIPGVPKSSLKWSEKKSSDNFI